MAKDPGIGDIVTAKVLSVKGTCNAGHKEGDEFEISCHNPAGLCGFFYHNAFPKLQAFQFGAQLPWWKDNKTEIFCPDLRNMVTIELTRVSREPENK